MSYNIDTFKLKTIAGLSLPVAALYKSPQKDWPLYPQLTEQGKEEAQKIKDLGEEIARLKKRIEQLQGDLHGNKA